MIKTPIIRGILAATMVAGAAIGIGAAPASAAKSDCPFEYFCAWQHPDFTGAMAKWVNNSGNWMNTIENQDSSWHNRGDAGDRYSQVKVYDGHYGLGTNTLCLRPGDFVASNSTAGDRGSSHGWATSC